MPRTQALNVEPIEPPRLPVFKCVCKSCNLEEIQYKVRLRSLMVLHCQVSVIGDLVTGCLGGVGGSDMGTEDQTKNTVMSHAQKTTLSQTLLDDVLPMPLCRDFP